MDQTSTTSFLSTPEKGYHFSDMSSSKIWQFSRWVTLMNPIQMRKQRQRTVWWTGMNPTGHYGHMFEERGEKEIYPNDKQDPYKEEIKIPPPHPHKRKNNIFANSKDPYFLYSHSKDPYFLCPLFIRMRTDLFFWYPKIFNEDHDARSSLWRNANLVDNKVDQRLSYKIELQTRATMLDDEADTDFDDNKASFQERSTRAEGHYHCSDKNCYWISGCIVRILTSSRLQQDTKNLKQSTSSRRKLTYAHVCSRMLTYAHEGSRMLTYAHVCSRIHWVTPAEPVTDSPQT